MNLGPVGRECCRRCRCCTRERGALGAVEAARGRGRRCRRCRHCAGLCCSLCTGRTKCAQRRKTPSTPQGAAHCSRPHSTGRRPWRGSGRRCGWRPAAGIGTSQGGRITAGSRRDHGVITAGSRRGLRRGLRANYGSGRGGRGDGGEAVPAYGGAAPGGDGPDRFLRRVGSGRTGRVDGSGVQRVGSGRRSLASPEWRACGVPVAPSRDATPTTGRVGATPLLRATPPSRVRASRATPPSPSTRANPPSPSTRATPTRTGRIRSRCCEGRALGALTAAPCAARCWNTKQARPRKAVPLLLVAGTQASWFRALASADQRFLLQNSCIRSLCCGARNTQLSFQEQKQGPLKH
jgi:hypothetical protein